MDQGIQLIDCDIAVDPGETDNAGLDIDHEGTKNTK